MNYKECPICFEKIGKIYKELECGHRYHFKCITLYEKFKNNENLNCSYCRNPYSIMKLRDRKKKLTPEEKIKKDSFVSHISNLILEVKIINNYNKNKKVILINKIFKCLIYEIDMLNDDRFDFKKKFIPTMISKLHFLKAEVDIYGPSNEKKISKKQYNLFNDNMTKILNLIV
jgi:hypothetical protein